MGVSWQGGGRAGPHQRGGRQLLERQLRRAWHRARSRARRARRARRASRARRARRARCARSRAVARSRHGCAAPLASPRGGACPASRPGAARYLRAVLAIARRGRGRGRGRGRACCGVWRAEQPARVTPPWSSTSRLGPACPGWQRPGARGDGAHLPRLRRGRGRRCGGAGRGVWPRPRAVRRPGADPPATQRGAWRGGGHSYAPSLACPESSSGCAGPRCACLKKQADTIQS